MNMIVTHLAILALNVCVEIMECILSHAVRPVTTKNGSNLAIVGTELFKFFVAIESL